MNDDLVIWLRAQLDAIEGIARTGVGAHDWRLRDFARLILRDVEAKRKMLDLHSPVTYNTYSHGLPIARVQCGYCASLCHSRSGLGCDEPVDALWPCDSVRIVALPYSDRPGYRDEWRP